MSPEAIAMSKKASQPSTDIPQEPNTASTAAENI
jgi:hypothetical protein